MIGAASSPMSMFTGGGNEAFQRGMAIGNANSPFSSVAEALRNTVDKYNAHLTSQQDQANKIDLLKQEYALKRQNAGVADPDAAGPFTQLDPTTGKYFIRSTSIDPSTGSSRVGWSPVSPNAPEDPVKAIERMTLQPTIDQMQGKGVPAPAPMNPIQMAAGASQEQPMSVPAPMSMAPVPTVTGTTPVSTVRPQYDPATQKLQQNSKGQYRVVPR